MVFGFFDIFGEVLIKQPDVTFFGTLVRAPNGGHEKSLEKFFEFNFQPGIAAEFVFEFFFRDEK